MYSTYSQYHIMRSLSFCRNLKYPVIQFSSSYARMESFAKVSLEFEVDLGFLLWLKEFPIESSYKWVENNKQNVNYAKWLCWFWYLLKSSTWTNVNKTGCNYCTTPEPLYVCVINVVSPWHSSTFWKVIQHHTKDWPLFAKAGGHWLHTCHCCQYTPPSISMLLYRDKTGPSTARNYWVTHALLISLNPGTWEEPTGHQTGHHWQPLLISAHNEVYTCTMYQNNQSHVITNSSLLFSCSQFSTRSPA